MSLYTENQCQLVVVPDLEAAALIAQVEREAKLTHLTNGYRNWDFWKGRDGKTISGRGKSFEALVWNPGCAIDLGQGSAYFQERGFIGHGGAFTAWVGTTEKQGCYVTIPDDNGCLNQSANLVEIPCTCIEKDLRELYSFTIDRKRKFACSLVGFRELL